MENSSYSLVFSSYPMPPAPHNLSLSLSHSWPCGGCSLIHPPCSPLRSLWKILASCSRHPPTHIPLRSLAPAVRDRGRAASGDIHACMSVCYVYIQLEKERHRAKVAFYSHSESNFNPHKNTPASSWTLPREAPRLAQSQPPPSHHCPPSPFINAWAERTYM